MFNLDEAIKHCEEIAEENYGKATEYQYQCSELSKCLKCGDEHMQLAEWLRDYKRLKEQKPTGHWIIMGDRYIKCSECGHITKTESPDIYNFCMVCGANMSENPTSSDVVEPQESEEKE